jgi:enterochelin esterase family protein
MLARVHRSLSISMPFPKPFLRRSVGLSASVVLAGVALSFSACSSDSAPGGAVEGGASSTSGGAGGAVSNSGAGGAPAGAASAGSNTAGESSGAGATSGGATSGGASGGGASGAAGSAGGAVPEVSSAGDGDITVGPDYTKDPNLTDLGKPKGKRFTFTMHSADSKIFKGDDATLTKPAKKTNWDRGITVYVPALYKNGTQAPILIIQEGQLDNVARALDNLTISTDPLKKLPAFVAIAINNGSDRDGSDGQGSERGLEYDTLSDRYSRFVETEVLPAVLADSNIKAAYPALGFTSDPEGRGTMGCSSGAAAALSMAWFTNLYHRVITYSGTFVDQQNHTQEEAKLYPFGAWEYHSDKELIKNTDQKPLRIFLDASEHDNGAGSGEANHHDWVLANQRTAAALKAKGYHYRFTYALTLGHCDQKVFDLTLADTLSWVWRGYPTTL